MSSQPRTVATPTADVPELAARLRLVTTRLARRLRAEADSGLTPSLVSALTTIHAHGALTLGELAERERVAPPTITKVVGRLEHEGLVAKEADPDDRRVSRVRTTSEGERLLDETRARRTAWLAERLAGVTSDDRARVAAALDVLEELATRDPL